MGYKESDTATERLTLTVGVRESFLKSPLGPALHWGLCPALLLPPLLWLLQELVSEGVGQLSSPSVYSVLVALGFHSVKPPPMRAKH